MPAAAPPAGREVPLAFLQDQTSTTEPVTGPAADPRSKTGQENKQAAQDTEPAATAAPMGECGPEYSSLPGGESAASLPSALRPKLSIIPLVFIIFYEVSGGPFGIEGSVGAAGPLLAIAGFLVLPLIWSVPEALITAELGTMFPENGGYVVWVASALGPYWGFQQGWMKWLSGVIDNALYPVLFLVYLKSAVPALGGGVLRTAAVLGLTAVLTLLNVLGAAVLRDGPHLHPQDPAGAVAGGGPPQRGLEPVPEHSVLEPQLLGLDQHAVRRGGQPGEDAAQGAVLRGRFRGGGVPVPAPRGDGLDAGGQGAVERRLLRGHREAPRRRVAHVVGAGGGGAVQHGHVRGGDEQRLVPAAGHGGAGHAAGLLRAAVAPRHAARGHPLLGVGRASALLHDLPGDCGRRELFIRLRHAARVPCLRAAARAPRPYRVPLGTAGCVAMLVLPTALIVVVLALSTVKVALVSLGAVAAGLVLEPELRFVEKTGWLRFEVNSDLPDINMTRTPVVTA